MQKAGHEPSGPLRHKKIETNKPTTTGGSPMPVLIDAAITVRPGKWASARAIPRGTPIRRETRVAQPEILRESHVICQTSASRPKTPLRFSVTTPLRSFQVEPSKNRIVPASPTTHT